MVHFRNSKLTSPPSVYYGAKHIINPEFVYALIHEYIHYFRIPVPSLRL